jgi:hypothetical protein
LANNFGTTTGAGIGVGDLNGNGAVEFADYVVLANNFGATAGVAAAMEAEASAMRVETALTTSSVRENKGQAKKALKVQGVDVMGMTMLQDVRRK